MLIHKIRRFIRLLLSGKLLNELNAARSHFREEKILPLVDITAITGNISKPVLLEENSVDGNISPEELNVIASLVAAFRPERIFEIGTFDGRTTLNIAANAPESCRITTLDIPSSKIYNTRLRIKTGDMKFIDKKKPGMRFIGTPYEKKITQVLDDSAAFDFSPFGNSIDFIFIDGSHSYEYVISDTENCRKLLRNGKGIILWHDYGWHEVVKALNNYYRKDPFFKELKQINGTSLAILVIK